MGRGVRDLRESGGIVAFSSRGANSTTACVCGSKGIPILSVRFRGFPGFNKTI